MFFYLKFVTLEKRFLLTKIYFFFLEKTKVLEVASDTSIILGDWETTANDFVRFREAKNFLNLFVLFLLVGVLTMLIINLKF